MGSEVVNGNVDSLFENLSTPKSVNCRSYFVPIKPVPTDGKLRQDLTAAVHRDTDVDEIWRSELQEWLVKQ